MKYLFVFTLISLSFSLLNAQTLDRQVVASSGQYFENANLNVQSTIGETVVATGISGSNIITQGFQQPDSTIIVNVENVEIALRFQLYPNPSADKIILKLHSDKNLALQLQLFDMIGRNVSEAKQISFEGSYEMPFDISGLAAGQYSLKLQDKTGKLLKAINFQKIK